MAEKFADQEFVEFLVKTIVGNPNDVSVERKVDEMGVLLTLHINQADMGYVIGKRGNTARAIRTLLKIVGAKNNARVNLKIYEPEGSHRPRRTEDGGSDRPRRMDDSGSDRPSRMEDVDTDVVDDLKI